MVSPKRDKVGLVFRLHPKINIRAIQVVEFLKNLLRHMRGPILMVWDRGPQHRSKLVGRFLQENPRLQAEQFPRYWPQLNPQEYVWGHLKMNRLANMPALEVERLARQTRSAGRSVQRRELLLRGFIRKSGLSLRLH